MRKLKLSVWTIAILAAFSSITFAGDYAQLNFIGFSENGRYLAFEEFGRQIALIGEFRTAYYVDITKNSFAAAPTFLEMFGGSNGRPDRRRGELDLKKRVSVKLRKLGIKSGNIGQFVVAHFLNDLSFVKPVERESDFYENGKSEPIKKITPDYAGAFVRQNTTEIEKIIFNDVTDSLYPNTDEFFELTLIPTLAKAVEGCSENYKFELTLKDNTGHRESKLQTLQKDVDILPASRNCPLGYKIERVYIYGDVIAVFLNVFSKGFDGPDMNYLVVAGKIAGR